MTWLIEDPLPTIVLVVLIEGLLLFALFKTGRGVFLAPMAGVLVLGAALLALEWFVVTDRETIAESLDGAARALEANDPQGVLAYFDNDPALRRRATQEMSRVKVSRASFSRLDVKVNHHTSPPSATADFMGYINAKDLRGEVPYESFSGRFTVELKRERDRWVLTGYEMHNYPGL